MLVSGLFNKEQLADLASDIVYIGLEDLSWSCVGYFSLKELPILKESAIKANKKLWVSLNLLYEEEDLLLLKYALECCKKAEIDGIIYCNLAVYNLAKEIDYQGLLIYQADTLITNSADAAFFRQRNDVVVLAKEITLKEIKTIGEKVTTGLAIQVHGHLNMSYSKRRFLSNYFAYINKKFSLKHNYYLQEETRDGLMPILQENRGTSIYSPWILESLVYLKQLVEYCDYFIINPLFLPKDDLPLITRLYQQVLDDQLSGENGRELLPLYKNKNYSSGYYFLKTQKSKQEVICEED